MKQKKFTIDQVVPHANSMSLLDRIEEYGDENLRASALITADSLFLTDGKVPSWVGIEYMAQTIAAFAGVQALLENDSVKVGFLVGTRKYLIDAPSFAIGDTLSITAQRIIMTETGLGAFDCTIHCASKTGQIITATATLNVFQPDNINEILKDTA